MEQIDLSKYNYKTYHPGSSALKRVLWYYVNVFFFKSSLFPFYGFKRSLLKLFGAKVGRNVEFKPCVNIKYPWHLDLGDYVWIGENAWIDCLVPVVVRSNVVISQGAIILTGNHDYKTQNFSLITGGILIEEGAWIGAGAIVNQGITIGSHAVLTAGSVATGNLEPYSIYQGNPAIKVRARIIS